RPLLVSALPPRPSRGRHDRGGAARDREDAPPLRAVETWRNARCARGTPRPPPRGSSEEPLRRPRSRGRRGSRTRSPRGTSWTFYPGPASPCEPGCTVYTFPPGPLPRDYGGVWLDTLFANDVRARTLTCLLLVLAAAPARAITGIDQEEDVSDLLVTRPEEYGEEETEGRRWAVIPQVGYGPDTGPLGGLKFTHRNLFGSGVTFDVAGDYSLNQQQSLGFSVGAPDVLGDGRFLAMFSADYGLDPQRDFFGLGNNDVGPDPVSTHEERDIAGELTLGWRPFRGRLAFALSAGIRHIDIEHGDRDDDTPFTTDEFPELPGIEGGFVNPIGLGLVYNGRDDLIWPTRGWRIIAKVSHTNRELGSDFQFTRVVLDVGYLSGFFGGRHVLGARVSGGFIDGPSRDVPFWELTELGGDDTLRGFFPRRFLGQAHALVNLEYRVKLF